MTRDDLEGAVFYQVAFARLADGRVIFARGDDMPGGAWRELSSGIERLERAGAPDDPKDRGPSVNELVQAIERKRARRKPPSACPRGALQ